MPADSQVMLHVALNKWYYGHNRYRCLFVGTDPKHNTHHTVAEAASCIRVKHYRVLLLTQAISIELPRFGGPCYSVSSIKSYTPMHSIGYSKPFFFLSPKHAYITHIYIKLTQSLLPNKLCKSKSFVGC